LEPKSTYKKLQSEYGKAKPEGSGVVFKAQRDRGGIPLSAPSNPSAAAPAAPARFHCLRLIHPGANNGS